MTIADTEKELDKIQYSFMIKKRKKTSKNEVKFPNMIKYIKYIYEKLTAKIILNSETLKAFPWR